MSLTKTQVRELLDIHGLAPSNALGQNFLCDSAMIAKIVRLAEISPTTSVIEVGPGLGSLTIGLCASEAERVVAVEKDKYLIPALESALSQFKIKVRPQIVNDDIMTIDFGPILTQAKTWTMVSNLPYNISTPLIINICENEPAITSMLVMVQKEVGERLVAPAGSKTFGIPSVLVSYWATAKIVGKVPPELFFPKPNVDSVLVKIDRRQTNPSALGSGSYRDFVKLVKKSFGSRRKMLRRSLAGIVEPTQFADAGIESTRRPEELSLDEWLELSRVVSASNESTDPNSEGKTSNS